jgi:hypothetical protein
MTSALLKRMTPIGAIVLAGYVGWQAWGHLGPRKPEAGPRRKALAEKVVPGLVEGLRGGRETIRSAILLHMENDPTDFVTDQLRAQIETTGALDLHNRSLTEKTRNLLNLRHPTEAVLEEAIEAGKRRKVDGVVYGVVHAFESHPKGARIDLEVRLVDIRSGKEVFKDRVAEDTAAVVSGAREMMGNSSAGLAWWKRLLSWAVVVLLLPVFTIGFIRTMVNRKSNRANAGILVIYTLVDAVLAYLMVGIPLAGWVPMLVFLVAVALALVYNIYIMSFAARLEEA